MTAGRSGPAPVVRLDGRREGVPGRRAAADTIALQGIDLDIARGEFVSLIGPSGCGKSTLLRVIGDLIQPTAGTVMVNGKPAAQARRDRDYGMVFQAPVLFDWRTRRGQRPAAAGDPEGARRGAQRRGRGDARRWSS